MRVATVAVAAAGAVGAPPVQQRFAAAVDAQVGRCEPRVAAGLFQERQAAAFQRVAGVDPSLTFKN